MLKFKKIIASIILILFITGCSSELKNIETLKKEKKYNEAIEKLKELLIKNPKDPFLHLEMGICYALNNNFRKSSYYFFECLKNKSSNAKDKNIMLKKMLNYVNKSSEYSLKLSQYLLEMLENKKYEDNWANIILVIGEMKYKKSEERLKELTFNDNINVRRNVHIALKKITGDDYIY